MKLNLEAFYASHRGNGGEYWASPEGKLGLENPVSTLTALLTLGELEIPASDPLVQGALTLLKEAVLPDGRVRIAPKGSIYPCHLALAAAALGRNGQGGSSEALRVRQRLLATRHGDGGWQCRKFSFGRGPETELSNPGVTLLVLDAFKEKPEAKEELDTAVETLLAHWTVKTPVGPCHFGMGSRFMAVEYPFLRYNLFYYVYVLSFYPYARKDPRFFEAWTVLKEKLDPEGYLPLEAPQKKLLKLGIYESPAVAELAKKRIKRIQENLGSLE